MKISDVTSDPIMASINGQPPQSVRQHLEVYKISTDDDMEEFAKIMINGRDIVSQIDGQGCVYMMVREFIPTKIAIAPGPIK